MRADQFTPGVTACPFRVGDWLIDPALDQVSRETEVIKLEPLTMRVLMRLADEPGQVVSSRQLLDSVWKDVVVGPASIYQAVSKLRKLLGDDGRVPTYIATVPRKGYRLLAPVQRIAPAGEDLCPHSPVIGGEAALPQLAVTCESSDRCAVQEPQPDVDDGRVPVWPEHERRAVERRRGQMHGGVLLASAITALAIIAFMWGQ